MLVLFKRTKSEALCVSVCILAWRAAPLPAWGYVLPSSRLVVRSLIPSAFGPRALAVFPADESNQTA